MEYAVKLYIQPHERLKGATVSWRRIQDLIQRLASGSCSGKTPQVQTVRRVEDSALWCRDLAKANMSRKL